MSTLKGSRLFWSEAISSFLYFYPFSLLGHISH
ncbi:hypothetical protein DFO67_1263 [Modicisalibacter xianhensis]|uniref:Uncharacterized protein n=1 Tax=Modicisalibacter xianhensis TaxID=442341 RepID=A0A4V3GSH6_9GAMM|nr:hypothetical protein DFO67_1263 [Halomonas xianhensis]